MYDHDSNFEKPITNCALFGKYWCRNEQGGDLGFNIDLSKISSPLQAEGFIDLLYEVEHIFYYKDVLDSTKVQASTWWKKLKQFWEQQRKKTKIWKWEKMKNIFFHLDILKKNLVTSIVEASGKIRSWTY